MTQFQWREVVAFISTLCSATLDKKGDALKENQIESCRLMLQDYPFIPKSLYNDINGILSPTGKAIAYVQAMRKAPGNVVVPYKVFDNNEQFADFILHSRVTTDDRWEVFGQMAALIRKHKDWPDYSDAFFTGLCEVGGTFVATGDTSAYDKAVNPKVEANMAEEIPQGQAEEE